MNVLNNIWLALSTPNEELVKFFSIPLLMLIEAPLSLALISIIFNIKFETKQKLIYIFRYPLKLKPKVLKHLLNLIIVVDIL